MLDISEKVILTAVVKPDSAKPGVTWSSEDANKATVNPVTGEVTAIAAGEVKIFATAVEPGADAQPVRGEYTINIWNSASQIKVIDVSFAETKINLAKGNTVKLVPVFNPAGTTIQFVNWSSSLAGVATVAADGTVTANNKGKAIITVTTESLKDDGNPATATVEITVTDTSPQSFAHWRFNQSQESLGWVNEITVQASQANLGNGLTLLGPSGFSSANDVMDVQYLAEDYGNGIAMAVRPAEAAIAGSDLFTAGMVRMANVTGTWGQISGAKGPYTLIIGFTATGAGNADRAVAVKIGSQTFNYDSAIKTVVTDGSGGLAPYVLPVFYGSDDEAEIYLKTIGGTIVRDVYLVPGIAVENITIDKSPSETLPSMEVGQKIQVNAAVTPSGAYQDVVWTSSNSGAAVVDQNGLITVNGSGTAVITATTIGYKSDLTRASVTYTLTIPVPTSWASKRWMLVPSFQDALGGAAVAATTSDTNLGDGLVLHRGNWASAANAHGHPKPYIDAYPVTVAADNPLNGNVRLGGGAGGGSAQPDDYGTGWATISGKTGPYRLVIYYDPTGHGNQRHPIVRIDGTNYNDTGHLSDSRRAAEYGTETGTSAVPDADRYRGMLIMDYAGNNSAPIRIGGAGGYNVYDIYIERPCEICGKYKEAITWSVLTTVTTPGRPTEGKCAGH